MCEECGCGAGKSTLLLHLNGILRGEGTVRVMGQEVAEPNLARIRAQVGLVFQDPDDQLFSPTVFDDVAFGPLYAGLPEEEIQRRVAWALAQVGLEGYAERMVAEVFPRMVVLDEGRVVADGPTDELLADRQLLETHGLE